MFFTTVFNTLSVLIISPYVETSFEFKVTSACVIDPSYELSELWVKTNFVVAL